MTEELKKGNEIIKKLQAEIKNYHTKVSYWDFLLLVRISPVFTASFVAGHQLLSHRVRGLNICARKKCLKN